MLPIDQLINPLSPDQVKASIYNLLKASGVPVTSWQEGAVTRTIIAAVASIFAGFTQVMATATRAGFLDLAEGVWLTLNAHFVYGVDRIEAIFATGKATLTNTGGGLFTMEPGDLILLCPSTKKTYTNVSAFQLDPLSTLDVDIRAVEVGAASTAPPNTITEFVTKLLGVEVTNAAPLVGLDAESDPALRQRCRDSLGALSPHGPAAAYRYWAKSAKRADGSSAGVTRVRLMRPPGDGSLQMYVASASGPVLGVPDDPSTDLGAVNKSIQENAVPDGVGPVTVSSATTHPISIVCTVWISTSSAMTAGEVQAVVNKKLVDYFHTIPIGGNIIKPAPGKVFVNALMGQVEAASPFILKAELSAPVVDVVLNLDEIATMAIPTIDVQFVADDA